jgi:hypothetical protein
MGLLLHGLSTPEVGRANGNSAAKVNKFAR